MEYQNQDSREEQGSTPKSEQNKPQSNDDMPTSAGGSKDHQDVEKENVVTEDASSRVRDENEEEAQPQIDSEGEFKNKTGWTREEGLSDAERGAAEEEDLNGRHSGDSSII